MLDRLIDLVIQFARFFRFVTVVEEYKCCIVMRFGRYHRELQPGARFIWPFGVESILSDIKVTSVKPLETQTLTLKDGKTVVVKGIITMEVENAREYFLAVDNVEAALQDSSVGVISEVLCNCTWDDLRSSKTMSEITRRIRLSAKKWGIKVLNVQFGDISQGRAMKLYVDNNQMWKSNGYDS